jgi:hypothetical protein
MAKEQNIDYALRLAYMTLIDGKISVNGVNVPVFKDGADIGNESMYIFIQSVGSTDRSVKIGTDTITSTMFSIYCKGNGMEGTEIEDISAQLLNKIAPYNGFTVPVNSYFRVLKQTVINDITMPVLKKILVHPYMKSK